MVSVLLPSQGRFILFFCTLIKHENSAILRVFLFFFSNEEAEIAIQNLNDAEFDGRNIKGIHKFLLINPHNNLFTSIYNFIILVFENS